MSGGGKNETVEHLTRKLVEKVGPWGKKNKHKTDKHQAGMILKKSGKNTIPEMKRV